MAYGRQTSFNLLIIAVLLSVITIACCSYQKRFGGYVPVYGKIIFKNDFIFKIIPDLIYT
jgi:hypothetical protein